MAGKSTKTVAALARQRRSVIDFGRTALKSDNLSEILTEACRRCSDALDTDFSKVMRLEDEGRVMRVIAGVGWKDGVVGEEVVPALPRSSEGFALFDGRPAMSGDLTNDDFDYPKFLERHRVRSILNVLIPGADDRPPFGLLQVDSTKAHKFTQEDIEFMQGYANIVGAAIERFDRSDALRRAVSDRQRALEELNHRVGNNLAILESLVRARVSKAAVPAAKQEATLFLGQLATLSKVHELLSSASDIDRIDIGGFLASLMSQLGSFGSAGDTVCEVQTDTESVIVPSRIAIPLGIVANEFVTNSLKYAVVDGRCQLSLSVTRSDGDVEIRLSDAGPGLGDALDNQGDPQSGSGLTYIEAILKQLRARREWRDDGGALLRIRITL